MKLTDLLQRYRPHVCVALSVLLFAALCLAVALSARQKQQWALATLSDVEARYARLKGLRQASAQLTASQGQVKAAVGKLAYPVTVDANRAGSDLQERVRKNFEAAGLSVTSSRIVEPKAQKNYDVISVSLNVTGSLANLQAALAGMRAEAPLLKLDELVLQPAARTMRFDPEIINGSMTVIALRQKQ